MLGPLGCECPGEEASEGVLAAVAVGGAGPWSSGLCCVSVPPWLARLLSYWGFRNDGVLWFDRLSGEACGSLEEQI